MDAGIIVIVTFISPFKEDRNFVRQLVETQNFVEIFVDCPLDVCMSRDKKGLYQKAIKKEISDFTGISSPYEKPDNPEIKIDTGKMGVEEATSYILEYLFNKNLIKKDIRK
jgi:adenylylsulfate kinase